MKCVCRQRCEPNKNLSLGWRYQANGWRYYDSIIRTTSESILGTYLCYVATSKTDPVTFRPVVEVMQVDGATSSSGFVTDWATLKKESGNVKTLASTGDFINVGSNVKVTFDSSKTGSYFAVAALGPNIQLSGLSSSPATLDKTTSIYAALTTSDNLTYQCSSIQD